jgi:hypothetical protein
LASRLGRRGRVRQQARLGLPLLAAVGRLQKTGRPTAHLFGQIY